MKNDLIHIGTKISELDGDRRLKYVGRANRTKKQFCADLIDRLAAFVERTGSKSITTTEYNAIYNDLREVYQLRQQLRTVTWQLDQKSRELSLSKQREHEITLAKINRPAAEVSSTTNVARLQHANAKLDKTLAEARKRINHKGA